MEVLNIYFKVKNLESNDIYLLLETRGVNIFHSPELFTYSKNKGRIMTDLFGTTSIFLKFNDGENPELEHFILWHELGHLETEGFSPYPRAFSLNTYRDDDESDTNIFAIFGIMHGYNEENISATDIARRSGLPFSIVLNCLNRIRQDERFMEYIHREKDHDQD